MMRLDLVDPSGKHSASRVIQFAYSHAERVVRAECRLACGDYASSKHVESVLLERFGCRGTLLLPAHFVDEARGLATSDPDRGWALECSLFDADGRAVREASAQWLPTQRYFYPNRVSTHAPDTTPPVAPTATGTPGAGERPADLAIWNLGMLPTDPGGIRTKEYAAWFFAIFDSHAQSDLFEDRWEQFGSAWFPLRSLEVEFRKKCIDRLLPPLVGRLAMRHASARRGENATQSGADRSLTYSDYANRPLIAYVSQLQLSIIDLFYPSWRTDGVDESGLAQAFDWFASGELLIRMYPGAARNTYSINDGAPTGPFIFMFAEFALFAIENGIDVEAWTKLLPLLASIQEIYWHAFGEPGTAMECRDYCTRHISQSPRLVSDEVFGRIREGRHAVSGSRTAVEVCDGVRKEIAERLVGMFSDGYRPFPVDWSDAQTLVEDSASRSHERA